MFSVREIPNDIKQDVYRITDEVINFENTEKLSWTQAYLAVLEKLGMADRKNEDRLLINVVGRITELGYDIKGMPFELESFR